MPAVVEGGRNPIFDACRALLARGVTGRLVVWRRGKISADMQLDIERGAALAIEESDRKSIRLRRYVPMPLFPCAGRGNGAISRTPILGTQPTKTAASDSTARRGESWVLPRVI